MARPLRIEYNGAFYHITSRGNEKKEIFLDDGDRKRFLFYLASATNRYSARIHVFCLMKNHYHLLLETPQGNLSQIMRHINGAYTTYHNTKHKRCGHLFQGRYKSILVDADAYAKELSRYIHLNPVRAGIVKLPKEYQWSSYKYYIENANKPDWLVKDFVLVFFGNKKSKCCRNYAEFVMDLIGKEYESPLDKVVASTVLGREDFVEEIKEQYLEGKTSDRNLPSLSEFIQRPSIEKIADEVKKVFGEDKHYKNASLYFCHIYSGMTLKVIGEFFCIGESAVSQASRRFKSMLATDQKIEKKVKKIEKNLLLSRV